MFRQTLLSLMALVALTVVVSGLRAEDSAPPPTEKRPQNAPSKEDEKAGVKKVAHDGGDTAWMLVSTAFVMLMVPGLALFYGGLARRKNLLGTMMQSMVALGVVGVLWVIVGYTLAFGKSQNGLIGWSPELLGLCGVNPGHTFTTVNKIPLFLHVLYQGMFAIITPALISGALAERIRFGPYCIFIALWSLIVYCPLAHWVWAVDLDGNPAGWLGKLGALDFAGGTVVHVAAGVSSLAAILLLRKRIGYPEHSMHPNSVALALLGAGLLWFGWFGFNGGSALGSGGLAVLALSATQIAAASAALAWMLIEWRHRGKPTALGFATGLVAGLVGITPASGFVSPMSAIIIGAATASVCYVVVAMKGKLKYDDSLDAFGVHGIGGMVGALLTGVFASAVMYNPDGTPDGGHPALPAITLMGGAAPRVLVQLVAVVAAVVFSFVLTAVLVKVIDNLVGGFCLEPEQEIDGLDKAVHGEVGFDLGLMLEVPSEPETQEPRPALAPPLGQKRFTVVVEGGNNGDLMQTWSGLCQAGSMPPSDEFKSVYPFLTTVQGNRFRFRGGDPDVVSANLQKLFEKRMSVPIRVRVGEQPGEPGTKVPARGVGDFRPRLAGNRANNISLRVLSLLKRAERSLAERTATRYDGDGYRAGCLDSCSGEIAIGAGRAGDEHLASSAESDRLLEDEHRLALDAQKGDRTAFATLAGTYYDHLFRWLYHLSHDRHTAEDLTQESLLKAFAAMERFKAGTNFRAWLFRIAYNNFVNQRRSAGRQRESLPDNLADTDEGPAEQAAQRESLALLADAVHCLPAEFRAAFLLRVEEGLSFRQIASILHLTEETARWRVFKARQKLLRTLTPPLEQEKP